MGSPFNNFTDSFSGFRFNNETPFFDSEQSSLDGYASSFRKSPFNLDFRNNVYPSNMNKSSLNLDFMNKYGSSGISYSNDQGLSGPVLRYINQVLLEDNTEERISVLYDPLTLQAAEKPFYDAIGMKYPPSPLNHQTNVDINVERPDRSFGRTSGKNTCSSSNSSNYVDHRRSNKPRNLKDKFQMGQSQQPNGTVGLSNNSSKVLDDLMRSPSNDKNLQNDFFQTTDPKPIIFRDSDSILECHKEKEEAMKFLPVYNQSVTDSSEYTLLPTMEVEPPTIGFDKGGKDHLPVPGRGRKHLDCEDGLLEEQRSRKQSAVYEKDVELSELFDKVLLYDVKVCSTRKCRSKKRGDKNDAIDLRTLLASCVRAIACNDRTTAIEKLEQIKKHASPTGDAYQRMANAFATGIEARLAGTGSEIYGALGSKKLTALEKLKAHEAHFSACPYGKLATFFANQMIFEVAKKATSLHIVDFGISYGFQWPKLIQQLSTREGGPPKLRITGIELPQAGFRPKSLVEETGQRLAKYCERFNVPFVYQMISTTKWENISVEELKLSRNEVVAVNCMFRFRYLLDETVVEDSPRDRVLKLIKKMKPDVFLHSIVNGAHHVPFFVNRFRQALFYYSALFDALDATVHRKHPLRLYFEEECYGREVVNVMSCEGTDRVERPETYKNWQSRNKRAGLKLLPLNPEIMNTLKGKVAEGYHKDFEVHEDGNWILQGWKGRILFCSSCWVVQ